MRVITGSARGRRLNELKGMETRPTTEKVKEAMFSSIQFEIEGRMVLDLFGGTGQLGIEALSRGAREAHFTDTRKDAVKLIGENLEVTKLADQGKVFMSDALSFLKSTRTKYDIIFLDPPYKSTLLEDALEIIAGIDILSDNGIIICESEGNKDIPALPEPFSVEKEYRFGKIKVTKIRRLAV